MRSSPAARGLLWSLPISARSLQRLRLWQATTFVLSTEVRRCMSLAVALSAQVFAAPFLSASTPDGRFPSLTPSGLPLCI